MFCFILLFVLWSDYDYHYPIIIILLLKDEHLDGGQNDRRNGEHHAEHYGDGRNDEPHDGGAKDEHYDGGQNDGRNGEPEHYGNGQNDKHMTTGKTTTTTSLCET